MTAAGALCLIRLMSWNIKVANWQILSQNDQANNRIRKRVFWKFHKGACARERREWEMRLLRVCQDVAESSSSFTRTTQAKTVLLLNITKNADTWQNEVAVNNLLRENSSSWIEASQILKLISRQSAFCEWFVLFVTFYAFFALFST